MCRITGPIYDINEGVWRRRYNEEIRDLARQLLITGYIRSQMIRWAGHIVTMEEGRMPKVVMEGSLEGRRPRMRWKDNVFRDLRELGVEDHGNNWGDAALNTLGENRGVWCKQPWVTKRSESHQ